MTGTEEQAQRVMREAQHRWWAQEAERLTGPSPLWQALRSGRPIAVDSVSTVEAPGPISVAMESTAQGFNVGRQQQGGEEMQVSPKMELARGESERAVLKRWMLGVMRGEELGAPEGLMTALMVDGKVRVVKAATAYWYLPSDGDAPWFVGSEFRSTTPGQRLAVLGGLMSQAGLVEDRDCVAAFSSALERVLAGTFKSVTSGLVVCEGTVERLAWKEGQGVACQVDGEWRKATGEPVDVTGWTEVGLQAGGGVSAMTEGPVGPAGMSDVARLREVLMAQLVVDSVGGRLVAGFGPGRDSEVEARRALARLERLGHSGFEVAEMEDSMYEDGRWVVRVAAEWRQGQGAPEAGDEAERWDRWLRNRGYGGSLAGERVAFFSDSERAGELTLDARDAGFDAELVRRGLEDYVVRLRPAPAPAAPTWVLDVEATRAFERACGPYVGTPLDDGRLAWTLTPVTEERGRERLAEMRQREALPLAVVEQIPHWGWAVVSQAGPGQVAQGESPEDRMLRAIRASERIASGDSGARLVRSDGRVRWAVDLRREVAEERLAEFRRHDALPEACLELDEYRCWCVMSHPAPTASATPEQPTEWPF